MLEIGGEEKFVSMIVKFRQMIEGTVGKIVGCWGESMSMLGEWPLVRLLVGIEERGTCSHLAWVGCMILG